MSTTKSRPLRMPGDVQRTTSTELAWAFKHVVPSDPKDPDSYPALSPPMPKEMLDKVAAERAAMAAQAPGAKAAE